MLEKNQINTSINDALNEAEIIHSIQAYEKKFNHVFYSKIIETVLKIDNDLQQYQALQTTFHQMNKAEKKLLQHAYKKVKNKLHSS